MRTRWGRGGRKGNTQSLSIESLEIKLKIQNTSQKKTFLSDGAEAHL